MRTTIVLSALCATALAAPAFPELNLKAAIPTAKDDLNQYFNMLAQKVANGKQLASSTVCDLSNAQLPVASPTALPTPDAGLVLKHVAIGRGTQNYTCDLSNPTAAPSAVGAVATLFNASCIAATYPDLLAMLPRVALSFNLSSSDAFPTNLVPASTDARLAPSNTMMISGHHYFLTTSTPYFDLNTTNFGDLGDAPCTKNATVAAPAGSAKGQEGEAAVPWLRLTANVGATGRLEEVYRVETAGGSAPANCTGMPAAFEVQYSAQYWFYESP